MRYLASIVVLALTLGGGLAGCDDDPEPNECDLEHWKINDRLEECGVDAPEDTVGAACDMQYLGEDRCMADCYERVSCEAVRRETEEAREELQDCCGHCGPMGAC